MSDPTQPPATPPNDSSAATGYGAGPAYGSPPSPAPPAYATPVGPDKYNVLAIVSFVSAFFVQLVAVITGHIALSQIKKTGEKGRGFAIAGLIIGYVGILASIIAAVIILPLMLAIFSNPNMMNGY